MFLGNDQRGGATHRRRRHVEHRRKRCLQTLIIPIILSIAWVSTWQWDGKVTRGLTFEQALQVIITCEEGDHKIQSAEFILFRQMKKAIAALRKIAEGHDDAAIHAQNWLKRLNQLIETGK